MAASHTAVWQQATVIESVALTSRIRRIVLAPERPVPVQPGAHVDVDMIVRGARDERSYSVVDATSDGTRIALSVYLSEASRGGAEVMHALAPGDRVRLTQPLQDFPLRFGAPAYVLLAGGIGVTAIAGMASALKAAGADYRFVYCGRSREAMAYLDELRAIHGDRLELHVGAEGTTLDVPDFIAGVPERAEVYLCGPIRLMDAVRRAWTAAGRSTPDLRFETFGNSGWFEPEAFRVSIPALGIETTVSRDQTLLEALEAAGADPLFDCRKGECGLCEARIIDIHGDIDHRDVFYSERQRDARSKICPCVSRIRSDAVGRGGSVALQLS